MESNKRISFDDLLAIKRHLDLTTPKPPSSFAEVFGAELRALLPGCTINKRGDERSLILTITFQGKKIQYPFSGMEMYAMKVGFSNVIKNLALQSAARIQELFVPEVLTLNKDFEGLVNLTLDELNAGTRQARREIYELRVLKQQSEIIDCDRYFEVNYWPVRYKKEGDVWVLITKIEYV